MLQNSERSSYVTFSEQWRHLIGIRILKSFKLFSIDWIKQGLCTMWPQSDNSIDSVPRYAKQIKHWSPFGNETIWLNPISSINPCTCSSSPFKIILWFTSSTEKDIS